MKTLILTMSPRKSFSASMYYSKVLKFFMKKGEVEVFELKTQKQYLELEKKLECVDNLVFATPVYVDTIPSTVLDMLVKLEKFFNEKQINMNVYTIINCGFYESEQCKLAQETFKTWCSKCNLNFKGGLSLGSGVMLAFIRTLIPIGIAITILETLIFAIISLVSTGTITLESITHFPYTLVIQTGLYLLWSMGLFVNSYKMAKTVSKSNEMGLVFTGLWFCPRFMFVIIASIYWIIASIIWYRGDFWRLLKEPKI